MTLIYQDKQIQVFLNKLILEKIGRRWSQPANIGPQNVPVTSASNVSRMSPKDPIWPSRRCPNLTSRVVLVWRSRGVARSLIRDIPRTFSGRPLENLQSTQTWMSQFFFEVFFQNLFDWPNLSKSISILKMYWKPSETSKMEHFLQN